MQTWKAWLGSPFLNEPSQVHIVVQFYLFIYLFILQMFFHSFKLAPFSLLTSKKYDKFLRVSLHIFHQAKTLKMLGVLFYIFWMSFYVNKIPNPFYKF